MAHSRICSIPGCGKPHLARGWCGAHWARWRSHGDPLGGGTTFGEPLAFFEAAINAQTDDCILWPFATVAGRGQIRIDGKMRQAHREICARVHGAAPTPEHHAAHNCGNGHIGCVNPRHLRWATGSENQMDRVKHGTDSRGERHGRAKVTEAQVREIRGMRGKVSQRAIAEMFGVSPGTISAIQSGRSWSWLQDVRAALHPEQETSDED